MSAMGPYRLLRHLGSCQVGTVWSAVDAAGTQVTIAVLNIDVARSDGWRKAFADHGRTLAYARQIRVLRVDLNGPTPWIACALDGAQSAARVFTALGQHYVAVPAEPEHVQTSAPPAQQTSAPPAQTSGVLTAGAATPDAVPESSMVRRRTGVWIAAAALLILLPGAGTAVIAGTALPNGAPSPSPSASGSTSPTPFVTPRPSQPGQEPPKDGSWPAAWPSFAAADRPKSFTGLAGLDVSFQAPSTWTCTRRSRTGDAARYACTDATLGDRFGGELLTRGCPAPCDDRRRTQLRRSEEAWGLPWTRGGTYTVFAESAQLDGGAGYGLVFVSFYRTVPEGPLDRELVFRMSAPADRANDLRKVANSIRRDIGA